MVDLLIVGGGVLGAFHAYHALELGLSVALLERHAEPRGASVRNFGQIVPSGLAPGRWREYGIESTRLYREIQARADISVRPGGSLYLASDDGEATLLTEMHQIDAGEGYRSQLLSKREVLERYPAVRPEYARAGLLYPDEITVEPRVMVARLLALLQERGLEYRPQRLVTEIAGGPTGVALRDARGDSYRAAKAIVCTGTDFATLYPELFAASDIEVVKLQMMETVPQPGLTLASSILSGLTIRRSEAFAACPSHASVTTTHPAPELQAWGIHLLFKQGADGNVVVGDSHEYRRVAEQDTLGFEVRADLEALILAEARRILNLPSWELARRWYGVYSQRPSGDLYCKEVEPNVHIVTAIGGKGMTASAGFARHHLARLFNREASA